MNVWLGFSGSWLDETGASLPPLVSIVLDGDGIFRFEDPATKERKIAVPHGVTLEEARRWYRRSTEPPAWPSHARQGA